jgi:hypothetical protein
MIYDELPGLPATGPMPEQFSPGGRGQFREGLVVRFSPDHGEPWVGNFQRGISSFSRVLEHPDGARVVVVAGGQVYIADPKSRTAEVIGHGISQAYETNEPRMLILDRAGVAFEAIDSAGPRWHTRRLSWSGFRAVVITANAIVGEAEDPTGGGRKAFIVDLSSGASFGGSYHMDDAAKYERLRDTERAG